MFARLVCVLSFVSVSLTTGFRPIPKRCSVGHGGVGLRASSLGSEEGAGRTWQQDVDEVLNVDTSCANRRTTLFSLIPKVRQIVGDVSTAVRQRDITKIAPPTLAYGKAVQGIKAVNRQVLSDIIPSTITKGIPRLLAEGPTIVSKASKLARTLPKQGIDAIGQLREMSQDPSALQYNLDTLRKEVRNVVKSTPEGLETPAYEVLKATDSYEVRSYTGYSVCSTVMEGGEGSEMADPLSAGNSFTQLANYLFNEGELAMTMPVISGGGSMAFVLPKGVTTTSAPTPSSETINLKDIPAEVVAVREFPGFATEGEVSRQRALLEDALLADGIVYDNLSFKVFQYNPPYTLPFLRRNEVALKIDMSAEGNSVLRNAAAPAQSDAGNNNFVSKDSSEFLASPEAGD